MSELLLFIIVYYESIKGEVNKRLAYECRCDERLKTPGEGSTCLVYTEKFIMSELFIMNR